MEFRNTKIHGAVECISNIYPDSRGFFLENFRQDLLFEESGFMFKPVQSNVSQSHKGVVRGIHFADVPVGQAKLVKVFSGAIVDYFVDLRTGSPTFGEWDSVTLNSQENNSIFLAEGLGHCFVSKEPNSLVSYLVSSRYNPTAERAINPFDNTIGLTFPEGLELIISDKDKEAPTFRQLNNTGLLPSYELCISQYEQNKRGIE